MMGTVLFVLLYLLALSVGLPLGWRLFGRSPIGWVTGALLGYGLTAFAFWVPIWLGHPHPAWFLLAWASVLWLVWRPIVHGQAWVALPAWTTGATRAFLAFMLLAAILIAIPFSRVGEQDNTGTRWYRAYFTADFVWHMSITQELRRFDMPPVDPYLAPEPIHYYWTYFLVPAVLMGPESSPVTGVESALKVTAIGTALLMSAALFLSTLAVTGRVRASFAACVLAVLAPSWEGAYVLWQSWTRGGDLPALLAQVREMNIDAVTAWQFQGLRIDGLVRSMWWTPQHATSFTCGLLAMVAAGVSPDLRRARLLVIGLLLGLSVAVNPLLGAAFCLIHGLIVLAHVACRRAPWTLLLAQAWVVTPVALALGWTTLNQMSSSAGNAVILGFGGLARHAPIATMVLSLGGLLVPAALAALPWREERRSADVWIALPAVSVALGLAWLVSLSTDAAWIGFRAGNILQISLPMAAAVGLGRLAARSRRMAVPCWTLLLLVGAPTTLIDVFNAQDIENRAMGPGFRWAIPVSPAQQSGFQWLRTMTAPDAVVQADPVQRGRDQWSIMPSFGGRRMAAGLPISLIGVPAYDTRSNQVHQVLTTPDLDTAHADARRLGIDYLWIDEDDPPATARRLLSRPELFGLLFRRGPVYVFDVR
ncbi:MAG: hypothetical protein AMXMBFR57_14130 [Acidimicrobiia bacterium]